MNKDEKLILSEAWHKATSILKDITELSEQNTMLAFGVMRQAEFLIEYMCIQKIRESEKKVITNSEVSK